MRQEKPDFRPRLSSSGSVPPRTPRRPASPVQYVATRLSFPSYPRRSCQVPRAMIRPGMRCIRSHRICTQTYSVSCYSSHRSGTGNSTAHRRLQRTTQDPSLPRPARLLLWRAHQSRLLPRERPDQDHVRAVTEEERRVIRRQPSLHDFFEHSDGKVTFFA